jgi:hypothetical protein
MVAKNGIKTTSCAAMEINRQPKTWVTSIGINTESYIAMGICPRLIQIEEKNGTITENFIVTEINLL